MNSIYKKIQASALKGDKLLAVLIDPDKVVVNEVSRFISKINESVATHIFVGGSTVDENDTEDLVEEIKKYTNVPVVLFPGDVNQITGKADGLLFLSLISGRNPDFLIGKHVDSVTKLSETGLEIIPTGYILIESGNKSAVERVTNTKPMSRINVSLITKTAKAGELLGMKLIYLEAGSGAKSPISEDIIKSVKNKLSIPLIVGGGIKNSKQLENAYNSGADLVVIGTAFEENESFFEELK
ncbi:geranylgeranylglyceryl/heptaprenylglyceryl phosphate synthase [Seonamhaeicola sp. S2-3]|uniref:geranylgeranylglyceryl/heptaprenylglyceryl phosphate synthase n=1 Tax=Seonamhaeicola sp. S2-3 TaxID=1936081 RepID=UPI00097280D6|nr:geranylgeranylglyceryl/heptaprenylglyceryl phosphate synthase [Seonamhaeicola sp. S2-3]APY10677.1 geranylgeranylglyceryl/heptaprenylglyceryl phosphate synthase [Seonamhaeicola sp. S2-3]